MKLDRLRITGVTCALLALHGCKVGPDFARPSAAVAEHWIAEPPEAAAGAADTADWWRVFNDATLDGLIDAAYHNNLSLCSLRPVSRCCSCRRSSSCCSAGRSSEVREVPPVGVASLK